MASSVPGASTATCPGGAKQGKVDPFGEKFVNPGSAPSHQGQNTPHPCVPGKINIFDERPATALVQLESAQYIKP